MVLNDAPKKIKLSDYADHSVQGENRYWKVGYGAYGQYYLGALQNLDIIQQDEDGNVEHLGEPGILLLDALDKIIPSKTSDLFFECVNRDLVSETDLKALSLELPPSLLDGKSQEGVILRKIFLESTTAYHQNRVQTFGLLLETAAQCPTGLTLTQDSIRYVLFNGAYEDGTKFKPSPTRASCHDYWLAFNIAEHLHYSFECLFWALLQKMREYGPIPHEMVVGNMVKATLKAMYSAALCSREQQKSLSFGDCLDVMNRKVANEGVNWASTRCGSFKLAEELRQAVKSKETELCIAKAIQLYSHIAVEYSDSAQIQKSFGPATELGNDFPDLNPHILLKERSQFFKQSVEDGLHSLFLNKIMNRHLNVALRKLSNQRESTFKFMLRDGNVVWLEDIVPTFTQPRLRSAMNIIADLKLASWEPTRITALGRTHIS